MSIKTDTVSYVQVIIVFVMSYVMGRQSVVFSVFGSRLAQSHTVHVFWSTWKTNYSNVVFVLRARFLHSRNTSTCKCKIS